MWIWYNVWYLTVLYSIRCIRTKMRNFINYFAIYWREIIESLITTGFSETKLVIHSIIIIFCLTGLTIISMLSIRFTKNHFRKKITVIQLDKQKRFEVFNWFAQHDKTLNDYMKEYFLSIWLYCISLYHAGRFYVFKSYF